MPTWCTISLLNLSYSSTCFEHYCAHHEEDFIVYTHHLVPDIVTLEISEWGTRWCIYTIKPSWWWAPLCSKHVEEYDRFNKEIVHQVGKQDFYGTFLLSCNIHAGPKACQCVSISSFPSASVKMLKLKVFTKKTNQLICCWSKTLTSNWLKINRNCQV